MFRSNLINAKIFPSNQLICRCATLFKCGTSKATRMHSCCTGSYQKMFDAKKAQNNLRDYHFKGVKNDSKPMLAILKNLSLTGASHLDIGGGVGAMIFESTKLGVHRAQLVDLSIAYVKTFDQEVQRLNLSKNLSSLQGDFLEVSKYTEKTDLVTLDKVICCYPDYAPLVSESVAKARKWYLFSIPRDRWWIRLFESFDRWKNRIRGKPFETYFHPANEIVKIISDNGFVRKKKVVTREWLTYLFEKPSAT